MTLTRLASQPEFLMPSVSWIVLGSIAGVVAGRIVNSTADGIMIDIRLGSSA